MFNQSTGGFAYLITPTQNLTAAYNGGTNSYTGLPTLAGQHLAPLTDFWYQRPVSAVIIENTVSGSQIANIPSPYLSVTFTDQTGYELRQGTDFTFQGPQWIVLSAYTPAGSTITANMIVKVNPYNSIGIMPENYLQVDLQPNETLAPNQVFIHTPAGTFTNPTVNADGTLTIPQLLQPGDWLRWEVRVDSGQMKATAKKWEISNLVQVEPEHDSVRQARPGRQAPTRPDQLGAGRRRIAASGVVQVTAGNRCS